MGVARGNFSEGFDSKNHFCRGLFVIGIPKVNYTDPKEIMKKRIMTDTEHDNYTNRFTD